MTIWLTNFRIKPIPSDGRDELSAIHFGISEAEYLGKVWKLRDGPGKPPRSHRKWRPFVRLENMEPEPITNITTIRKHRQA